MRAVATRPHKMFASSCNPSQIALRHKVTRLELHTFSNGTGLTMPRPLDAAAAIGAVSRRIVFILPLPVTLPTRPTLEKAAAW